MKRFIILLSILCAVDRIASERNMMLIGDAFFNLGRHDQINDRYTHDWPQRIILLVDN